MAEFYRTGGQQEQDRYVSIEAYLKNNILPLPTEQVFDESAPLITFQDIYVPLNVQPLTQSGERKENTDPINIHNWAQEILGRSSPHKVMFIEGDAGRGKSVFCRMFAAEICQTHAFSYIPLFIQLRSLRAIENTLTETLENCPDLEPVEFVGAEGWLKDKNIRFLIILDGFDELLLQGRASGGLQEFLQQVSDFQERSHHQCLVTGRPLALQGIEQRITQNKNLERVKLEPMNDEMRQQWMNRWRSFFGDVEVNRFQKFLQACPKEIANKLAREPLLIYLLARLHREGQLTSNMFVTAKQESRSKLRIYQESVKWVLEKQRQDENLRLSGLDDAEDLREILQEAALCVIQSGNETAQLTMLKARFRDTSNPVASLLQAAQKNTRQTEDKVLNNLLTTFYLRPGEDDKRGAVEFAHKSFSEYLFAERLISTVKDWIEVDRRKRDRLDDQTVHAQIYDLLGFDGLSTEIIEYLFELLEDNNLDQSRVFNRLYTFYKQWYEDSFLNQAPTENSPQKKLLQLKGQNIPIGLKQINVSAGLNILIILFKLHAIAQAESSSKFPADNPNNAFCFHPCEESEIEQFDGNQLLKIIHYSDSLDVGTFSKIVGPHLANANLTNANLTNANLTNANLTNANLSNANLSNANLTNANLTNANLTNANLSNANLSRANLDKANLSTANLSSTNLLSANLSRANLVKADSRAPF
nr:pentapeptide repeat-containing protein [Leptolyngbya sp. Heron Island J]